MTTALTPEPRREFACQALAAVHLEDLHTDCSLERRPLPRMTSTV